MGKPLIEIDPKSGFCFGVTGAVNRAESELRRPGHEPLYCLGEIVHNSDEVERLSRMGMRTVTHADLPGLTGATVLLRAHGEPPSTYATARKAGIRLIDATCPVVIKLQERIRNAYKESAPGTQIVIYGRPGHAEVNGLVGQTDGTALVVQGLDDLDSLDYSRNIKLYSQTTKSPAGLTELIAAIEARMQPGATFAHFNTICKQVSGRFGQLRSFAAAHDAVIFVSGEQSSNGRVLHAECLKVNPRSYKVTDHSLIRPEWLDGAATIGICGATSTPRRLLEQAAERCRELTGGIITQPDQTEC